MLSPAGVENELPCIIFVSPDGAEHEVDAPEGWSLMESATKNGIEGILADCGGACSCATCHVYVDPDWMDRLPPRSEMERDMIECVPEPRATSRLACQIAMTDALSGLRVEIPEEQV